VNLEDAADDSAVGEHVEIVVVPIAGWYAAGLESNQARARYVAGRPLSGSNYVF
jgi:hypothetical protein